LAGPFTMVTAVRAAEALGMTKDDLVGVFRERGYANFGEARPHVQEILDAWQSGAAADFPSADDLANADDSLAF